MFTALSERLTATLKRLTGRGVLSEQDVTEALREIRRHLLEADVSFEVTTGFVERVRERAVGVIAVKSVSPGQQVAKLVHDEIAALLGGTKRTLDFAPVGPTVILLVGLQGSGKTTTAAKLARRLKLEQKAPGLVAADPYRPAAGEQLRQLGELVGVPVFGEGSTGSGSVGAQHAAPLPSPTGVVELVYRALREAEKARCRTVIVDTAGRLQIDAALMGELKDMRAAEPARSAAGGGRDDRAGCGADRARGAGGGRAQGRDPDEARRRRAGRRRALDPRRDRPADQVHRHGGKRRGAACCAPTRALRPAAHGGAHSGPGRRGGAGRAGGGHRGRGGGAAARAESALEARDGPGGFPGRAEADAGDGAAQAGAGPLARGERQGAGRRTGRRQAPEARGGDRAVDDAGGAGRPVDPQRLAPAADRQGGGSLGAGRAPAAAAVRADAGAPEEELGNAKSHHAAGVR